MSLVLGYKDSNLEMTESESVAVGNAYIDSLSAYIQNSRSFRNSLTVF